MSVFYDFLKNDYPRHFKITWDDSTMQIHSENPASVVFEIQDQKPTIVQPTGKGVSVIRRKEELVEIVNFEEYSKTIHGTNNTPNSCDFIISPSISREFIILNELTNSASHYISPFVQASTGIEQTGKLEYAKMQLTKTIERIYEVSNILDSYDKKIALFSCRLSDKSGNNPMMKSAKHFSRPIMILEKMELHETLPHGFKFIMRVYNKEYRI